MKIRFLNDKTVCKQSCLQTVSMLKKNKILIYFIALLGMMQGLNYLIGLTVINLFNFLSYNQKALILLLCVPITYIGSILLTKKLLNVNLSFKWLRSSCSFSIILNAIALIICSFIIQIALDKTFFDFLMKGQLRLINLQISLRNDLYQIVYFIVLVFLGPILEEILYRRIIFRKLSQQYSILSSICITAILFAIMHLSIEGFIAYFFVGIIYTYLYHLTKNLWLNIFVHFLYNLLANFTRIEAYPQTNSFYFVGFVIYISSIIAVYLTLNQIKSLTKRRES